MALAMSFSLLLSQVPSNRLCSHIHYLVHGFCSLALKADTDAARPHFMQNHVLQDRAIGKPVLQIGGSIPAVNYIQLPSLRSNSLGLTGQYVYCQVSLTGYNSSPCSD